MQNRDPSEPEVIIADRQSIVCQGIGSLVTDITGVRLGGFATDRAGLRTALNAGPVPHDCRAWGAAD